MSKGELVLYTIEDGSAKFFLREQEGRGWLRRMELTEPLQKAGSPKTSVSGVKRK